VDEDIEVRLANGAGAKSFNAPEIILNQPWDCSADIWSLGVSVKPLSSALIFRYMK
jgi:hypothetical protein